MIYFYSAVHLNIASYADECSTYTYVIDKLEFHSHTRIKWYENNYLKLNLDKWHLILSEAGDNVKITIGNEIMSNSVCEEI